MFERDLPRLKKEMESYREEANIWKTPGAIQNSAGNLCLHLIGNLKTYIGLGLGNVAYQRNRDHEFTAQDIARERLLQEIEETHQTLQTALERVSPEQLSENFPLKIWQEETPMDYTLIHLYAHLNYHLGQITYHRRIVEIHKNSEL